MISCEKFSFLSILRLNDSHHFILPLLLIPEVMVTGQLFFNLTLYIFLFPVFMYAMLLLLRNCNHETYTSVLATSQNSHMIHVIYGPLPDALHQSTKYSLRV